MNVLVTGATGLVGKRVVRKLVEKGHQVSILTRSAAKASKVFKNHQIKIGEWKNPSSELPPLELLEGIEAVINLMGENIAAARWSSTQKAKIRSSRIASAKNLVAGLLKISAPLKSFAQASAIGVYPANYQGVLDENSKGRAEGFLGEVCRDWENSISELPESVRKIILRTGVVFGHDGGALAKLLPLFKLNLGGPIGDGKQMMSWIHASDLASLFITSIEREEYKGILNAVAPGPVSNTEFTKALASSLGRFAVFPVPPIALKTLFGEMSCVILDSQEVTSLKLRELGHKFSYPDIDSALKAVANKQ